MSWKCVPLAGRTAFALSPSGPSGCETTDARSAVVRMFSRRTNSGALAFNNVSIGSTDGNCGALIPMRGATSATYGAFLLAAPGRRSDGRHSARNRGDRRPKRPGERSGRSCHGGTPSPRECCRVDLTCRCRESMAGPQFTVCRRNGLHGAGRALSETARTSPALSARVTSRIYSDGISKQRGPPRGNRHYRSIRREQRDNVLRIERRAEKRKGSVQRHANTRTTVPM